MEQNITVTRHPYHYQLFYVVRLNKDVLTDLTVYIRTSEICTGQAYFYKITRGFGIDWKKQKYCAGLCYSNKKSNPGRIN